MTPTCMEFWKTLIFKEVKEEPNGKKKKKKLNGESKIKVENKEDVL